MSDPLPLKRLSFISPNIRRKLARGGFSSSSDVLRCATVNLAKYVGDSVTLSDVRRWQAICSLLEINAMTLDWAITFSGQAIGAAQDLGQKTFSQLTRILAEAKQRGDVANNPDADVVAAMMVDATAIRLGGVLNATVVSKGKPIQGARILCGTLQAVTDDNGRARLIRLPRRQQVEVIVEAKNYLTLTERLVGLNGPQVVEGRRFSLRRGKPHKAKPVALSEFDGDVISINIGQRIRSIEVHDRPLRQGDILYFFDRLQNGEVKLASRFKELQDGHVTVPVWRVPANTLPANAALRSTFRVTPRGLERIEVTTARLARWQIARELETQLKKIRNPKERHKQFNRSLKVFLKKTEALRFF